jgi:NAD(P)-dependent dehydrogenase (short-subunit alcohol dehydrogenase family)
MRLAGKVAVVTGGGSGIGRGIVLALAREGADLAIPDIQVLNAEKVAGEVKGLGRKVLAMKTDVTSAADVKTMVDRTRESFGKIDILVNNAGAAGPPGMPFTNNTEEDWDRTFAVNTKSVFLTCKAITPHFIERKAGRIVNIASIAGPISAPTMPPYSVAKMGVITLTRIIAKELAPHGVTVNAICPGVLWTDFWQKLAAHLAETNPVFKGMTARQVFDKRGRHHADEARADPRGHRLGRGLPRLRRSAQHHRPSPQRRRRRGDAVTTTRATSRRHACTQGSREGGGAPFSP